MALFEWRNIFRREDPSLRRQVIDDRDPAVGVQFDMQTERQIQTFDNDNITYRGDLINYNYQHILHNKQKHIYDLYRLADYFCDADDIVNGILKHVLVPYSICSPWQLLGVNEKTRKLYEEKYKKINLKEKLSSIMLQYWKYGNVFVYYHHGNIITLPPLKCEIGNICLNGDPIVNFDCQSIYAQWRDKGYHIKKNWINDNNLFVYFNGYPEEVIQGLNEGYKYVQLNPKNTYVLQGEKEDWTRYSIPFIAACLPYLAKKALISKYEDAMLNLGIHSFVHVKYGDEKHDILPNEVDLMTVSRIFSHAMNGFPLATTNKLASAEVIKPDNDDLFQWDKYKDVNKSILSAGGISGLIVTGTSSDASTFASAQVSMQTAAERIETARDEFCDMMDRINARILEDMKIEHTNNLKQIPKFIFMPLDMNGRKSLRDACKELWDNGVVSTKTFMEINGYSIERETMLRSNEKKNKTDEVLAPRSITNQEITQKMLTESSQTDNVKNNIQQNTEEVTEESTEEVKVGRPQMTDEERTSDPESAMRGKMPKPSNPEGSL